MLAPLRGSNLFQRGGAFVHEHITLHESNGACGDAAARHFLLKTRIIIPRYGGGSKPMKSHCGLGAPPILEPILVGIGMFTGGTGFWPIPRYPRLWLYCPDE